MGLVVDITPPDYNTRVEIVKSYASELGLDAENEVYEYIAENFDNNVRELKGAFNKVCAYAEFMSVGLTLDSAKKALNCEAKKKSLTIEMIATAVADYFDTSVKDMKSSARNQKVSKARQLAIYVARDVLGMSYESIGDYFEKKHTTVLYAYEQVSEKLKTDMSMQSKIDDIKSSLKG
jgi:chromosomal replication initiator protein